MAGAGGANPFAPYALGALKAPQSAAMQAVRRTLALRECVRCERIRTSYVAFFLTSQLVEGQPGAKHNAGCGFFGQASA